MRRRTWPRITRRGFTQPAERVERVLVAGGQERARVARGRPARGARAPARARRRRQLGAQPPRGGVLVGLQGQAGVGVHSTPSVRSAPDGTAACAGGHAGIRTRMRRAVAGTLSLVVAAGAGCGGRARPTSGRRSNAGRRARTLRARRTIRHRRARLARRSRDLDRLTVRAVADIGKAADGIQDQAAPKGSEARVAPFVESLEALDPVMEQLRSRPTPSSPPSWRSSRPSCRARC